MIKPINASSTQIHIHRSQLVVNDSKTEHITIHEAKRIISVFAVATLKQNTAVVLTTGRRNVGSIALNFGYKGVITIPVYANNEAVHIKKEAIAIDNSQYTGTTFKTCTTLNNAADYDSAEIKLYVQYEY